MLAKRLSRLSLHLARRLSASAAVASVQAAAAPTAAGGDGAAVTRNNKGTPAGVERREGTEEGLHHGKVALVDFVVSPEQARAAISSWHRKSVSLSSRPLLDQMQKIYVPVYSFHLVTLASFSGRVARVYRRSRLNHQLLETEEKEYAIWEQSHAHRVAFHVGIRQEADRTILVAKPLDEEGDEFADADEMAQILGQRGATTDPPAAIPEMAPIQPVSPGSGDNHPGGGGRRTQDQDILPDLEPSGFVCASRELRTGVIEEAMQFASVESVKDALAQAAFYPPGSLDRVIAPMSSSTRHEESAATATEEETLEADDKKNSGAVVHVADGPSTGLVKSRKSRGGKASDDLVPLFLPFSIAPDVALELMFPSLEPHIRQYAKRYLCSRYTARDAIVSSFSYTVTRRRVRPLYMPAYIAPVKIPGSFLPKSMFPLNPGPSVIVSGLTGSVAGNRLVNPSRAAMACFATGTSATYVSGVSAAYNVFVPLAPSSSDALLAAATSIPPIDLFGPSLLFSIMSWIAFRTINRVPLALADAQFRDDLGECVRTLPNSTLDEAWVVRFERHPLWRKSMSSSSSSGVASLRVRDPLGYYEILGLSGREDVASSRDVLQAFRTLASKMHPDRISDPEEKNKATARFQKVVEAYLVLKETTKRQQYDILASNMASEEDSRN